ncbi:MAG: hypothetical protein ABIF40_01995 [archaeon]
MTEEQKPNALLPWVAAGTGLALLLAGADSDIGRDIYINFSADLANCVGADLMPNYYNVTGPVAYLGRAGIVLGIVASPFAYLTDKVRGCYKTEQQNE